MARKYKEWLPQKVLTLLFSILIMIIAFISLFGFLSFRNLDETEAKKVAINFLEDKYGTKDFLVLDFVTDKSWLSDSIWVSPLDEPDVIFSVNNLNFQWRITDDYASVLIAHFITEEMDDVFNNLNTEHKTNFYVNFVGDNSNVLPERGSTRKFLDEKDAGSISGEVIISGGLASNGEIASGICEAFKIAGEKYGIRVSATIYLFEQESYHKYESKLKKFDASADSYDGSFNTDNISRLDVISIFYLDNMNGNLSHDTKVVKHMIESNYIDEKIGSQLF